MDVLTALLVLQQLDPSPEPDDVVAGWGAFGLFGLGILTVALLGWSLVRQLRKVDRAEEMGLYDPSDRAPRESAPPAADPRRGPGDRRD